MTRTGFSLPPLLKGLSARLLVLTVFFVMLSEVAIYVPSVARFRLVYLQEKLAAGELASLALEATPDHMVSEELRRKLLAQVGARGVVLVRDATHALVLSEDMPAEIDASFDLSAPTPMPLIRDAFETLRAGPRVIRVMAPARGDPAISIEVILDEAPMRAAMFDYSGRIMALSIVISLITASLVFLSLQLLMVRPMRRITESMMAFHAAPEDVSKDIAPSRRGDEIGMAQRELAQMQSDLRAALRQKTHLAALGAAVSKINHDLRGILSTAVLMSDRLSALDSPEVKRISGPLIQSIDRAINLCTQTLNFVRDEGPELHRGRFRLTELIDEVAADLSVLEEEPAALNSVAPAFANEIPSEVVVEADRDQLYRVFANLTRNASQVGAHAIGIKLAPEPPDDKFLVIDVVDDGPGMAKMAQEGLFKAFAGSARKGGTGLGLVIVRDVLRAHGGNIELLSSDDTGTTFRLTLLRAT